jgi:hypothetical protein
MQAFVGLTGQKENGKERKKSHEDLFVIKVRLSVETNSLNYGSVLKQ